MIYFLIAGLLFISSFLVYIPTMFGNKTDKIDRQLYIIFAIVLIVFAAFRNNGLDFESYQNNYALIHGTNISLLDVLFGFNNMETFFQLLNYIMPSFRFFIIACVGLCVLTKIVFYYKNFNNLTFCLFLYYCSVYLYFDFGIFRQGLAIAIIWLSIKYIKKKKFFKFLLCILIASLFHITALLSLPAYFVKNKQYSYKYYSFLILIAILLSFIVNQVVILLSRLNLGIISYKALAYTSYLKYDSNTILSNIKRILIFVVCLLCLRGKKRGNSPMLAANNTQYLYLNMYFLSIVEMIAFSSMFVLATRGVASLYYLYIPVYAITISNKEIPKYLRLVLFLLFAILSFDSLINTLLYSAGNTYIPYNLGW